ncbi:MAG: hypothetical protein GF364_22615 [Candidatus Lokiarchaeota archaeon]|nr:hypothetical protein [Candidatus Lokiarchaeota archaeon]
MYTYYERVTWIFLTSSITGCEVLIPIEKCGLIEQKEDHTKISMIGVPDVFVEETTAEIKKLLRG